MKLKIWNSIGIISFRILIIDYYVKFKHFIFNMILHIWGFDYHIFEGAYSSLSSDPRVIIARLDHTIVVERLDCSCFILYIRNHISWDYGHILQIDIVLVRAL